MLLSTERFLITHTGSLPRPEALARELATRDRGEQAGGDLAEQIRDGVREAVDQQVEAGVDVVNDGEASKFAYSTYVKERLEGFGGAAHAGPPPPDFEQFPEYMRAKRAGGDTRRPACDGPVRYRDLDAISTDIANFTAALAQTQATEAFLTAASPGVIAHFLPNKHYPSHEAYVMALADAMKTEYDAIHAAGFLVQLDCPDLAAARHRESETLQEFRRRVRTNLDALDHATRDIPPDRLRLHVCWGNYEAPHIRDIPFRDIVDLVFQARPAAVSFEAANPRHAHEWTVFEEFALPDDKAIIPGVLDSTTNYVEHPELVAQRLERYANLVGRERVLAGTDCGFATFASSSIVHPTVVWAKLRAMTEGARIASERFGKNRTTRAG